MEKINPSLPQSALEDDIKQCERIGSSELLSDNEAFHKLLVEGVKVDVQHDGIMRGEIVYLVDFEDVSNNDFVVVNQFTLIDSVNNPKVLSFYKDNSFLAIQSDEESESIKMIKPYFEELEYIPQ